MHRTVRYWGAVGLSGCFALLGLVFGEQAFLLCAAGLLGWLLAVEHTVRRRIRTVAANVTVATEISHTEVVPEQPVSVAFSVATDPLRFPVPVRIRYPDAASVTAEDPGHELAPGETEVAIESQLRIPFAGAYDVGRVTATLSDPFGLFEETVAVGSASTVSVEPRQTGDIHVGQAGQQYAFTFGEHGTGTTGRGMDPAETRVYLPGDPASRINWKATARLGGTYVDEFEVETVRPLVIVLDSRTRSTDRSAENPAAYRRDIAAALVAKAAEHADPIALYEITADGVEVSPRLSASQEQYATLRDRLYRSQPSTDDGSSTTTRGGPITDSAAAANRLRGDGSTFGITLTPFLAAGRGRMQHLSEKPLVRTVETYVPQGGPETRVAILAGDGDHSALFEAVRIAGHRSPEVLAFATPEVLFEVGSLVDIDRAYSRYADFERFRSRLDRLGGVTAFEVAPSDTIETVLAASPGISR